METCKLYELIPKEKLKYLFEHSSAGAELDASFLCFEEIYKKVTDIVSKDKIIIDLGCAYAPQSWYFRDYEKYIGVDIGGNNNTVIHTDNSEFYFTSIQDFINNIFPKLNINLENVFAVCSYVPDFAAQRLVVDTFPYCYVYYPNVIDLIKEPRRSDCKCLNELIADAKKHQSKVDDKEIHKVEKER